MSIPIIEALLAQIAKERGEELPKIDDTSKGWYEGGFVLDPPVGIFSGVAILDFSKYYPSIMMDFNLSPEMVKFVDSKPMLDFSKKGLIPEALERLSKTRSELEEKLRTMNESNPEYLDTKVERERVKVTQNAMYGALANEKFSIHSRDLASFITSLGREGLKETIAECERKGFKVYYADTDSVMVEVSQEKAEELARNLAEHLQSYFKKTYQLPITKSELRLKFSDYAKTIMFLGKKNYAFLNKEDKLKIVGLFRQAKSTFAQAFQRDLYEIALHERSTKSIQSYLKDQLEFFRAATLEDIAIQMKLNRNLDDYEVNAYHVRGIKNAEAFGIKFKTGDVVKLLWLQGKTDIIAFNESSDLPKNIRIDYGRMEEQLKSLVKPILEILGKGKETKQKTLF